jgi:conjugal transfer pilus assembly protein TraE
MKRILQKSRIRHLTEKRNGYLIIAVGSIVVNILLSIYICNANSNEKIIFIPPVVDKPFWVSSNASSPEYLSMMNLLFTDLLLNITPSNAGMKHAIFLKYVDSKYYANFKTKLIEQEDQLKKEHTTISFQLIKPEVDVQNLVAKVTGDVQYTVGDTILPSKRLTYQMKFSYHSGLLQVTSFEEVKSNA